MDTKDMWSKLIGLNKKEKAAQSISSMHKSYFDILTRVAPRYADLECQFMYVPKRLAFDIICQKLA